MSANETMYSMAEEGYDTVLSLTNSTDMDSTQREYRWVVLPAYLLVVAAGLGNSLVCLAVRSERTLHSTFNFFLVSLAISDLLCATLVMPVTITKMFLGESR